MARKIKVLNLYAGIGGNRKLWENVEVTAVEYKPEVAAVYKDFFPNDNVIVDDAHKYLINNYDKFEFIWASPPCPTHSRTNTFLHAQGIRRYPDMKLWQEIVYLQNWAKKQKWVIENVISYYEPFIKPTSLIDRHYYWANFDIPKIKYNRTWNIANARASTRKPTKDELADLGKYHGFDLSKYKDIDKRLALRNCVHNKMGLHIFNCAFNTTQKRLI